NILTNGIRLQTADCIDRETSLSRLKRSNKPKNNFTPNIKKTGLKKCKHAAEIFKNSIAQVWYNFCIFEIQNL
ncbi:hypothetical protein, partial [Flavobacterium sp. UBA6046]|uniref:hypothetical protein n=1 Tax=Flavobacterium sp. UBA6046 TaxID=1946552 RepID=UPI0025BFED31